MKKNIIIGVSVLISITFFIYAKIKANEAEQNALEAVVQTELALTEESRANELGERAQRFATEAREAEAEVLKLMELLEACKNK